MHEARRAADLRSILEFLEVQVSASFDLPAADAVAFFQAKGLKPTFAYGDMIGEAHQHAFTVAKMMDVDLLGQVRASLDDALANGQTFRDWSETIMPLLQASGWWGRKEVVDPLTGQIVVAELGSPSRLETIFRTNMQTAYAAGQWREIVAQSDVAPLLMYDAVDDFRTRPLHRSWDRKILPVGHSFWNSHYPPNGWNCRCGVIQMSEEEAEAMGLQISTGAPQDGNYLWTNPRTGAVHSIPNGIDPGFDRNAGSSYLIDMQKLMGEKVAMLPPSMRKAAEDGVQKAAAKAKAEAAVLAAQQELAQAQAKAALVRAQALAEAKAKQAAAQAKLDLIAAGKAADGGASYKVQAFKMLDKAGELSELLPSEKLAAVLKKANDLKVAKETSSKLSLYKKAILEGKTPAPGLVKAFDTLTPEQKADFLSKIDAEKAAAQAALEAKMKAEAAKAAPAAAVSAAGTPPNTSALIKIGEQKGSNPGGLYQDTETGVKWYVKKPASEDIARNEVLAGKLYDLAGIDVPELHLVTFEGVPAIASKIVDGLAKADADRLAIAAGTAEGFAVDAWLANWDVVGLAFDNLLMRGARAFRVDTGGALRYRAQGGLKGSAWGDDVLELESLRDASKNRQSQAVFGRITDAQIEDGVVRVLSVSDQGIRDLVAKFGPLDPDEASELAARLIARKRFLSDRYPEAAKRAGLQQKAAETSPPAPPRVTEDEQRSVEESRVNGYGFPTDSDQIEDNMVVVHAFKREDGSEATRGWLKLTPGASDALRQRVLESSGSGSSVRISDARDAILSAVKSINYRADKGQPFDATVVTKIENALQVVGVALKQLRDASAKAQNTGSLIETADTLETWSRGLFGILDEARAGGLARKLPGTFPASSIPDELAYAVEGGGPVSVLQWKRVSGTYKFKTARFERSFATEKADTATAFGVNLRYEAELPDGTRLTYFPHETDVAFAMQGVIQVDAPSKVRDTTGRVFDAIDAAGIKSTRASATDRQHLYLNAFARIRLLREPAVRKEYDLVTDRTEAGVAQKLAILKRATGVDIEASEGWKTVDGVYQAFGHGRAYQYRPDLEGPEFQQFERDYVLFHNPHGIGLNGGSDVFDTLKPIIDGGGVLASLVDRIRRGVPINGNTSPEPDMESGGGSYMFTRILRRESAETGTGLFWKARAIRRMDAVTYQTDQFGRTTDGHMEQHRLGQDVESLKNAARGGRNETNFKNGLSFFDDLENIVLSSKAEVSAAVAWMKERGYKTWPDGRKLDEVIITKAQHNAKR